MQPPSLAVAKTQNREYTMSKLNQIENILIEIEGGLFQKVCDAYIFKKENKISSTGSQDGTNKTVKGTPDSYILKDNGNYIFIEYTTQRDNLFSKIKKDIIKCFDESATGVPVSQIEKIIYCHTGKLSTKESHEIINICKSYGCVFDGIDISTLSFELTYSFPQIAHDLLGIPIDTGQLLTTNAFISYRSKTLALNNDFYFRENELEQIINSFNTNDITVITGKPGTGKTRIALEAMKMFQNKRPEFKLLCIENKGVPIHNDFQIIHGSNDKTLLLIDDANRFSQLLFILSAINENNTDKQLKIIITVRDYGLKDIFTLINSYKYEKVIIDNFKRDQISKIIMSDNIGIKNPIAIERICSVSKGNARLAIMASSVVLKTNDINSITDTFKIYDQFFENLTELLEGNDNKQIKKVLGIISYFHVIDKNRIPENLYDSFNILEGDFWDCVIQLYSYEIVDLYENQVCKISDQVIAVYFFYKTVFSEKILDFNIFLVNYFLPHFPTRMIEAVIPSAQNFDFNIISKVITQPVKDYWEQLNDYKQYDQMYDFANTFWFIIPNEVLYYLNQIIENLDEETSSIDYSGNVKGVSNKIYKLLRKYSGMYEDEIKISIQLACKYFIKRNDVAHDFSEYLQASFGFDRVISLYNSNLQIFLFNVLFEEANKNQLIRGSIMHIAPYFLKMDHENTFSEGMSFTITRFGLNFNTHIETLHSLILDYVKQQSIEFTVSFIQSYLDRFSYTIDVDKEELKKAVSFDSNFILEIIDSFFNWNLFAHCKIAYEYFDLLKKHEVHNDKIDILKKKANTRTYSLYDSLSYNRYERLAMKNEGLTYSEIDEKQKKDLSVKFNGYDFEDYKMLLDVISEILQFKTHHDEWQFRKTINKIFENLIESKELFFKVIEYLLSSGNKIKIDFGTMPYIYFIKYPVEHKDLYCLLKAYEFKKKYYWIYQFFYALPESIIDDYYLNELINFSNEAIIDWNFSFDLFIKFDNYKRGSFISIIKILFKNKDKNNCSFSLLFNPYADISKYIEELFKDDKPLLQDIWLNEIYRDITADHNGQVLRLFLIENPSFITKYLDRVYSLDTYISDHYHHIDFEFIWSMDSYIEIMEIIMTYIINKDSYIMDNSYLNVFFTIVGKKEEKNEIVKKQIEFIRNFISKNSNDTCLVNLILKPVKKYYWNELEECVLIFLSTNKNLDSLKELSLEYEIYSGNGTFLPVYNKMLNFWESLKTKLDSLEFIEIRQFISEKIDYWRSRIADEDKRNFIGHIYI